MANGFSKEEVVNFDAMLEGFEDSLTISTQVGLYETNGVSMERANDTMWRPTPYIMSSKDRIIGTSVGTEDVKQLSVPSTLSFKKNSSWKLSATEMRDPLQQSRLYDAAKQKLASDINSAVRDNVSIQGSLCVSVSGAAGTYDNVASCESLMDESGIFPDNRKIAFTTRDYNGMAGNLANRATMTGKPTTAYERSWIGNVANFDAFKMDTGYNLAAITATPTINTTGNQVRYVPLAAESTTSGEVNVDNRYQQVVISDTTGIVQGGKFTIAGVGNVHMIEKGGTGQLKTFTVISVDSGTEMTISPPIIGANSSPTNPELMYQNAEIESTSATAAITFLNDTATRVNPFWYKDSIELLPGRYSVPEDEGVAVMRAVTKQGIEVVMTKKFDPDTFESSNYVDTFFGVVNTAPDMNGVLLFNQS